MVLFQYTYLQPTKLNIRPLLPAGIHNCIWEIGNKCQHITLTRISLISTVHLFPMTSTFSYVIYWVACDNVVGDVNLFSRLAPANHIFNFNKTPPKGFHSSRQMGMDFNKTPMGKSKLAILKASDLMQIDLWGRHFYTSILASIHGQSSIAIKLYGSI